jgi:hypothetical protein
MQVLRPDKQTRGKLPLVLLRFKTEMSIAASKEPERVGNSSFTQGIHHRLIPLGHIHQKIVPVGI